MSVRLLVSRGTVLYTVLSSMYLLSSGSTQYLLTLCSSQFYPVRVQCILYKNTSSRTKNKIRSPESKQRPTQHFGARRKRLHQPKSPPFPWVHPSHTGPNRGHSGQKINANTSTVMAWPVSPVGGAPPKGIYTKVPYFLGIMTSIPRTSVATYCGFLILRQRRPRVSDTACLRSSVAHFSLDNLHKKKELLSKIDQTARFVQ